VDELWRCQPIKINRLTNEEHGGRKWLASLAFDVRGLVWLFAFLPAQWLPSSANPAQWLLATEIISHFRF
jgi:hypothetical protein